MTQRSIKVGRLVTALAAAIAIAAALAACGDGAEDDGGGQPANWEPAFEATDEGWLLSVAGASPDDLWAVGGTPEQGRIHHLGPDGWTHADAPDGVPLLNWVHVFDDGSPVIAGNAGTVLWPDGDGWRVDQTPTNQDLWGVWGQPDDLWAVGGNGRQAGQATVLRYDGSQWRPAALPALERPNVYAFYKVWGSSPDDVWIVGQRGAIVHYDGQTYTEMGAGTSNDLISVWGTGPDDVWVTGGRSNGVVWHFDGSAGQSVSLAPLPGMNGVWTDTAGQAWLGGQRGTIVRVSAAAGGPEVVEETRLETSADVHAVFGISGEAMWTVGGNFGMPQGPYEGLAFARGSTR